jgi:hypothetical protein
LGHLTEKQLLLGIWRMLRLIAGMMAVSLAVSVVAVVWWVTS